MSKPERNGIIKHLKLDYPAACERVTKFGSPKIFSDHLIKHTSGKLLIVAENFRCSDWFDETRNICEYLIDNGCEFMFMFANGSEHAVSRWFESCAGYNSDLHQAIKLPRSSGVLKSPVADVLECSYHLKRWLQKPENGLSRIVCVGSPKILHYPILARDMGLIDFNFKVVLLINNTRYFHCVSGAMPIVSLTELNQIYAENQVFDSADFIFSNSQHFLNWMAERYSDRGEAKLSFLLTPLCTRLDKLKEENKNVESQLRLVFIFGENSLAEQSLCVEAIERMELDLGKLNFVFCCAARTQILPRLKSLRDTLGCEVEIIQPSFFPRGKVEKILGSIVDQADLVVLPKVEGLSAALVSYIYKFSSNVLMNDVSAETDERVGQLKTFAHNPGKICNWIYNAIESQTSTNHISVYDHDDGLLTLLRRLDSLGTDNKSATSSLVLKPTICVCIAHFNRGVMLKEALASIEQQTYPCSEIIVVDDGSTDPEAISVLAELENRKSNIPIKVLRQENSFLGRSRNYGLNETESEFILFMDDDNLAKPIELQMFVRALNNSHADIFTCFSSVFVGQLPAASDIPIQTGLYVGSNPSSGLFANYIGDSNMFVRVNAARRIGGFTEFFKTGRDDQDFLVRADKAGLKVKLIPEPLYYYRLSTQRMRKSHTNSYGGHARVLQSLSAGNTQEESILMHYAQGLSYVAGPWGANIKFVNFKLRLVEFARIYIAKFPLMYKLIGKLRKIVN